MQENILHTVIFRFGKWSATVLFFFGMMMTLWENHGTLPWLFYCKK